jgi:hypothetical protein
MGGFFLVGWVLYSREEVLSACARQARDAPFWCHSSDPSTGVTGYMPLKKVTCTLATAGNSSPTNMGWKKIPLEIQAEHSREIASYISFMTGKCM